MPETSRALAVSGLGQNRPDHWAAMQYSRGHVTACYVYGLSINAHHIIVIGQTSIYIHYQYRLLWVFIKVPGF